MRFELLRHRVERAERRVATCTHQAEAHRAEFGQAWRRGWTPGRIVLGGFLSGFLVGRAEPLSRVGGTRWLQMLGTVSSMLASLRAAAASVDAGDSADVAARQSAATRHDVAAATGPSAAAPAATPTGMPSAAPVASADATGPIQPPTPAEAATELSER